ncbi:MAG: hypothetical protein WAM28_00975 [Chlamydiales bacterium]
MKVKKQLDSISVSRWILYLVILGLFPLVYVGYDFLKKKQKWESVLHRVATVRRLSETKERRQSVNHLIREKYADVDSFYIDKELESLSFLEKERESLEKILQSQTFTGNEWVENRFAFISGGKNSLQFVEEELQLGEGFQESIETLSHPVEVDSNDLKNILTGIETYSQRQPQLIITDFMFKRKSNPEGSEVYELTTKFLKREFIK